MTYADYIDSKRHIGGEHGFEPIDMPSFLFPFQQHLVGWALRKGRAAMFADCGLGKTPMQLAWADNVRRKTGKPVLIMTPLAVGAQTVREAHKFGYDAAQSRDGKVASEITVTNYQQLHKFDRSDFGGVVCDESSILKNFAGKLREEITDFMQWSKYRLLCTATAAPNDWVELGCSSEALGYLRRPEMLAEFFTHDGGNTSQWRLKKHASIRAFWHWVCHWARAARCPADLGFEDDRFRLPRLITAEHVVKASQPLDGFLFDMPAVTLNEQREERRRTLQERCEQAAALIGGTRNPAVAWCHLNEEGHLLEKLIDGAVEVEGSDPDEFKEETFEAFAAGQIRVLVSKPVIAGFGLNWQHCAHQTFFPSHSFEQCYQCIRRSWRFGQKSDVKVDIIASEGERGVIANLSRKAEAADQMFRQMVALMNVELQQKQRAQHNKQTEVASWLEIN